MYEWEVIFLAGFALGFLARGLFVRIRRNQLYKRYRQQNRKDTDD